MKFHPNEAIKQGFIIDRHCYPWAAYKGDRFKPTEIHDCYTALESELIAGYKPAVEIKQHWSTYGTIAVKILTIVNRELNKEDEQAAIKAAEDIIETLILNSRRANPDEIKASVDAQEKLLACFDEPIFVETIENEYNKDPLSPWFVVTTKIGRIKIGWRKRVIHISWDDSLQKKTASELFPDVDTTKMDFMIHAWNYEKAREYISKIVGG